MNAEQFGFEENVLSLKDYLKIIKRRLPELLIVTVLITVIALLAALLLPATYESKATILIEEQEIPREFVQSAITSFAAQQIQVIRQRILTVENIKKIADKFNLYRREDGTKPPSTELAMMFREDMSLDLVSAEVIDPRSGQPSEATIAFTLGYKGPSPTSAQRVANELVTLFLDENLRLRTQKAISTTDFLKAEAETIKQEMLDLEAQLARFKEENEGSLPELYQFNLSNLERNSREVADIDIRIKDLAMSELDLSATMSQLSPTAPVLLANGESVLGDVDRLKSLRSESRRKTAIYKPNHPDLVRLAREIAELEAATEGTETRDDLLNEIARLEGARTDLTQRYAASHPRIVSTTRQIEDLRARIDAGDFGDPYEQIADNPAYVFVDTQLKASKTERAALESRQQDLQRRIEDLERKISRAPEVEKQYQALIREISNTEVKYRELIAKQGVAQLSENLEQEQKGEQYSLIEPAVQPLSPSSPNRPLIALVGLFFAIASGIGLVVLRESLDGSIYGVKELSAVTGAPPFAVVPYIENAEDVAKRTALIWKGLIGTGIAGAGALLVIHFAVRPLDVVWFTLLNRLTGG